MAGLTAATSVLNAFSPTIAAAAIDAIVAAVRDESAAMGSAPLVGTDARALALLLSSDAASRVCAVQLIARQLVTERGDVRAAALLQRALAEEVSRWPPDDPLRAITLQTVLTSFASLAVDGGLGLEVLRHAGTWLCELRALGDRGHVDDMQLRLVEALLHAGRYEEAAEALAEVARHGLRGDLIPQRMRLQGKVDALIARPDEPIAAVDHRAVLQQTLAWLRERGDASPIARILEVDQGLELAPGEPGLAAFPPVPRSLAELEAAAEQLGRASGPLAATQALINGAARELQAAGRNGAALAALRRIADRIADAADAFGYWEEATTARWIACVTLRRERRHLEAVERLVTQAARIDERRLLVRDPRLRAGLAVFQPQLPWALAESGALAGNGAAALFGMEVAKARILADLRPGVVAGAMSPATLAHGLAQRLSDRPRLHLLSFLVDHGAPAQAAGEIGVRALLRHADGDIRCVDIAFGESAIKAAARTIDERVRVGCGLSFGDIFAAGVHTRPFDDVLEAMAPLIAWLEPLFAEGRLAVGDTIAYAADGPIHNLPLAMLPFAGRSLIDHFALVAMPSLALGVHAAPAMRPIEGRALLAPDDQERACGLTYEDEIVTLQSLLPTSLVPSFDALLPPAAGHLLHISAHSETAAGTPLRGGGLVLSDANGRYDPGDAARWISPEKLAAAVGPGSHLTLRCCLIGQVEQITSREALGAVWSALANGAASVVAASWSVNIPSAARWCDHFYAAWLRRGLSRAMAHREACLALRAEGGGLDHPAHWAPFVLYTATLEGDIAMNTGIQARVDALSDKQAIHYFNQLASSPQKDAGHDLPTSAAEADQRVREAAAEAQPRGVAELVGGSTVGREKASHVARGLLAFLAGNDDEGALIVGAVLDGPPAETADFGILSGAAIMLFGWLAVTGDIHLKGRGFEYTKKGIPPAAQARLAKDFLGQLARLVGG